MFRLKYYATMFAVIIGLLTTFWQVELSAQAESAAVASQISPASSLMVPMGENELNPFVPPLGALFGDQKTIGGLAFLAPAAPVTYTVNVTTDTGAGSGTTGDLRYAITQVNAGSGGDTINITATGTITLGSALPTITKAVTINGPGADLLTISGNHIVGVLKIGIVGGLQACITVSISDLTIANGLSDFGGGIEHRGCVGDVLTLTRLAFSANNAFRAGGGLYAAVDTVIENCTFSINSGGSSTTAAINGGGAIFSAVGSLKITNSTFSANRADRDAGPSSGGAINAFSSSDLTIINSTFTGNLACSFTAGGIFANNVQSMTLRNTIVAGNCGFDFPDVAFFGRGTASISNSLFSSPVTGVTNGVNGNIITAAALLGPLGDYGGPTQTFPLLPGSPARFGVNDLPLSHHNRALDRLR